MAKRLNGSAGTGKKIMNNLNQFRYNLNKKIINKDKSVEYDFDVTFGNTKGTFKIKINANGTIDQYSMLDMDNFSRPLGIYNDSSLSSVANYIISN